MINVTYAQSEDRFFLEVNTFRYGANLGILRRRHYNSEVSIYNGLNLGYKISEKMYFLIGFRKLKKTTDTYYKEENNEVIKTLGGELTTGLEYSQRLKKRVYLSYMVGMYFEYASHKGRVGRPGAFLGIDHLRQVIGFAGKVQLNYRPFQRIEYFINSRLNYGYSVIRRKKGLRTFGTWGDSEYWNTILEPIGGIGLRFWM